MPNPTQSPDGKPAVVKTAVALLFLGAVLSGFMMLVLLWISTGVNIMAFVVSLVTSGAFFVWLILNIGGGRNWARITYLVLFLVSMPFDVWSLFENFGVSVLLDVLSPIETIIQIVALVLLFGRHARPWFVCVNANSSPTSEEANRKN